jgi:hypothetical protein
MPERWGTAIGILLLGGLIIATIATGSVVIADWVRDPVSVGTAAFSPLARSAASTS